MTPHLDPLCLLRGISFPALLDPSSLRVAARMSVLSARRAHCHLFQVLQHLPPPLRPMLSLFCPLVSSSSHSPATVTLWNFPLTLLAVPPWICSGHSAGISPPTPSLGLTLVIFYSPPQGSAVSGSLPCSPVWDKFLFCAPTALVQRPLHTVR